MQIIMPAFDPITFKSVLFGVLLPSLFSFYIWSVYLRKANILDGLDVLFFKSVKNSFYLSICSVVVSSAALYLLYDNKIKTEILLYLTMAISAGLSSLLIRNLLVFLFTKYPSVFEKKYDQKKVDKIVRRGVMAGYAAVIGIMFVVVNELYRGK